MKLAIKWDASAARATAKESLDAIFMPRLAQLMTPKAALYQMKAGEADKVLAGGYSSPLLAPEAEQHGLSEAELAREVLANQARTNTAISAVETLRQIAQAEIADARSPAAMEAILENYR